MTKNCTKHGRGAEDRRAVLDGMMGDLPASQAGAGRHKCSYCAYERGFEDGLQRAAKTIRDLILKESRSAANI